MKDPAVKAHCRVYAPMNTLTLHVLDRFEKFELTRTPANIGVLGDGAQGQNRTADTRIFNPLLYRLSYLGTRSGPAY
jgi:hypothetical protein